MIRLKIEHLTEFLNSSQFKLKRRPIIIWRVGAIIEWSIAQWRMPGVALSKWKQSWIRDTQLSDLDLDSESAVAVALNVALWLIYTLMMMIGGADDVVVFLGASFSRGLRLCSICIFSKWLNTYLWDRGAVGANMLNVYKYIFTGKLWLMNDHINV